MSSNNFNYFTVDKAYRETYFQFPHVLMYGERYSKLTDSAKLAYMIFLDRLQYSIKNQWIDEESNVYFIYTNKEIGKLLNKSEPTVIKIKKELEKYDLLYQKQMGFDPKVKRNIPNRLYLADLEVTAKDVYLIKTESDAYVVSGTKDSLVRQQSSESRDSKGTKNSLARQNQSETLNSKGTKDSLLNQYKEPKNDFKDIKDLSDDDFNNAMKKPMTLEQKEKFKENYGNDTTKLARIFGVPALDAIDIFSSDHRVSAEMKKIMYGAHEEASKIFLNTGLLYDDEYLEYWQDRLTGYIHSLIGRLKTDDSIQNPKSYIFISLKNFFIGEADDYRQSVNDTSESKLEL